MSAVERGKRFHIERRPWDATFGLHMIVKEVSGALHEATCVTLQTREDGAALAPPFLALEHDEAQMLFNELWQAGLRPTTEIGSEGERQALKAHITDLRGVVKALLPRENPDKPNTTQGTWG